jgi:hypothetical protein
MRLLRRRRRRGDSMNGLDGWMDGGVDGWGLGKEGGGEGRGKGEGGMFCFNCMHACYIAVYDGWMDMARCTILYQ